MKDNLVCYHCSSVILPGKLIEADLGGVMQSI